MVEHLEMPSSKGHFHVIAKGGIEPGNRGVTVG